MHTTLNKILEHEPCNQSGDIEDGGWALLLHNLGKTKPDNRRLSFRRIIKSNGIKDAIWALRTLNYIDYCMFNHDVAMLVIDNYEREFPNDDRPRKAIEAVKLLKKGKINKKQLETARSAAESAASSACSARSAAESAAWSACSARSAAESATESAIWSVFSSRYAESVAWTAAWSQIEKIFIKHFG